MTSPLLPIGCYDLLFPAARQHSQLAQGLLNIFSRFGYQQVTPSLLEYSQTLLAGRAAPLSDKTFRIMDSSSPQVLGIRADITPQIARLVASRLADAPLPLRVCYNGLILQRPQPYHQSSCQLRQAGLELVGADSPEADAEIIQVAVLALQHSGIKEITVDLNLPGMVPALLEAETLPETARDALLAAIAHKDISAVRATNIGCKDTLVALLESAGPANAALEAMQALKLPPAAKAQYQYLKQVITLLRAGNFNVTVDATEQRGAGYHEGITFSVFVPGLACEVGRGGRYHIESETQQPIPATGFTLYIETLADILPANEPDKRIFVPHGTAYSHIEALQEQGYTTIQALPGQPDTQEEATRMGCGFIYENNAVKEIR